MKRIITGALLTACLAVISATLYWLNYENWVLLPRARALISDKLRDPSSTQFRNDALKKSGWHCGEINTKNGSGGYNGFSRFISRGMPGTYSIEGVGLLDDETADQMLARLNKQIAILKHYNSLRKDAPGIQAPTEEQRDRMAFKELFEDNWKAYCLE